MIYGIDVSMMSHLRTVLCFNREPSWGTEASSRLVRSSSRIRMRGGRLTDWLSNSIWKHRVNVAVRDKESAQGVSLELYFSGIFPESEAHPPLSMIEYWPAATGWWGRTWRGGRSLWSRGTGPRATAPPYSYLTFSMIKRWSGNRYFTSFVLLYNKAIKFKSKRDWQFSRW